MKQLLIIACLCFTAINGFSQFCGSDHVHGKNLRDNPILESQWDALEQQWARDAQTPKSQTKSPAPFMLPVVVHIVHNNGPENISDALAIQAIQDLNEAFANVGYYDPNTGVDTRIQFCLAQRTPTGAATNGITRNVSPLTIFDLDYQDITLKNLNRWDPLRYINIWVVRDICSSSYGCGIAGYAYFPTSHGRPEDGLVVEANYMGLTKANSSVLVHEMGHYLGLYHTFQDGCFNNNCSLQGDRVCDTPPDGTTAYSACNAPLNSCSTDAQSGFTSDQLDLISDYMDYSDLNCYSVFTAGQRDRMHFFIDNVRSSLVNNLSCVSPCPNPVIAGFTTPSTTVTIGTPVNFTNTSSGLTGTWSWRNNGTVFATTQNASQTFNTLGTYTIQLVANSSNSTCSADSFSVNITVVCANPVVARFTTPSATVNVGTLVNFTNTSSGNTGTWSWRNNRSVFANTQNASQTFNSPGTYTIQLLANSGNPNCPADSFSINITVICQNPVTARFTTQSTTVNIGTPVNFTNTSSGNTGTWSWRNNRSVFATTQNASQTFNSPGTYTIQLVANSGTPNCPADSFSINITVICPNPVVARFTTPSTTVNVGTPVNFTNTSSGNTGTWSWRNNRSVFATTQNASQTFNSPGTYTIQLLASSSTPNCPADSFSINITVVCPALVAGFTTPSTTVNVGTPVNFTNTSTGPVGNWSWRNNGTVFATTQNASQTFNTTGTYTIQLVANSSNLNCPSDSFSVNITAICPVQVSFTGPGTNLPLNSAQTFISQTSNTTSLEWRVNNTIVGTGSSLTFNFTSQGVYEVCLIGRNGFCSQQWCNYYVAGNPSGTGCDGSMAKLFNRTNSLEQSKLIKASGDGNYYIAGRRGDSTFIMKVTQMGVALWDRTFDFGVGEDFLSSMIIDSDLNIVGSGFANGSGTPFGFAYKYNPSLNSIIWNKRITTSSYAFDIFEKSPGGNYVLVTFYDNAPAPGRNSDGGLLELNRNSGNAAGLSKQYSLFNADNIQECIPFNNGYYAFGRVTSGGTFSTMRPFISYLDASGNEVWSKSYFNNPTDNVRLYGKDGLIDNNALVMVVTGDFSSSNNYVTNNIGFIKTDINGTPLWSKRYTFPFSNVHPVQVSNLPDGYLIAVTEYVNFNRFAILKIDKSGNVVWSKEYARNGGGMVGVYSNDIVVIEPNNLVFAPSVYANGTDWAHTFIKTDLNGNVTSVPCSIANSITVTATTLPNYSLSINLIEYSNQCILTNATTTPRNSATSSSNLCYTPCEVCNNGTDDDGDGLADCNDTDCCNFPTCTPPVLNIGNDIQTCQQTGVTLDAGAGYLTYRWSNNTTNRTLVVNAAGTYRVTVTTACHTLTDAIQVTYIVPPTLELGPNITLCENGTRQITATPGFVSYQWNDGSTGNTFTAFRTGLVKVTATDACGGTQLDSVSVQIAALFPFDLGRDTVICRPVSLRLQVPTVAGVTYSWYPNVAISCNNCASPTVTPSVPTRYYVVVSNSNGCVGTDSILVTPNVCTVNVSITQRACLGTTLSVNGVSTTVPNTLTFNYTTTRGIDSIVTVRILALDTFRTNVTLRACRGTNATFNGTPIPAGTGRSFRLTTINGCDSTIVVNVIPNDTFRANVTLRACRGSNATFNGTPIPAGTSRSFRLTTINGCDSTIVVNVIPNDTFRTNVTFRACRGSNATFNGTPIPAGTSRSFRLTTVNGCDSTVIVNVIPNDTFRTNVTLRACRGSNATFNSTPIPAGTSRSFRLTTINGCDSTVVVNVIPNDTFRTNVTLRACRGTNANFNGTPIPAGTSRSFRLTTVNGCDSTVVVNVVPNDTFRTNVTLQACRGTNANFNGTPIPAGTSRSFRLTTINGCDSTIVVNVIPVDTLRASLNLYACPGNSATYNGQSLAIGTVRSFGYTSTNGCDSIVSVRVLALDTFRTNLTLGACRGSNGAVYNSTTIAIGASRSFRFTATNGCDSTVVVSVIALDTFRTYLDLYACQGSNVSYNGQSLPIGTIRIFNFSATNGCDSSVLVRVLGLPTSSVSISQSICNGQSYTFNGQTLTTAQTVTARLINRFGCDSLVTLTLQVRDTTLRQVRANACRGTSFVFDGVTIPAGGSRSFRYTNSTGCDSIVDVTVTARDTFRLLVSPRLCQGQSYVIGSLTITRDTSICRSLTSQWGCDSIVCHNISFAVPGSATETVIQPTCFQSNNGRISLTVTGGNPPFHYYWTPVITDTSTLNGLLPRLYTVTITDTAGCSINRSILLTEPSLLQSNYQVTTVSCPGYSDGMVNISAFGGTPPYRYNIGSGPAVSDSLLRNLSAGRYLVSVTDDNDCLDTLSVNLVSPSPLSINVWRDTVLNLGDTMQIRSAIVGIPPFGYAWSPSNGLSCDNCPEPVLTTDRSRVYTVIMTDARGCSTTDTLRVITLANNCAIYLPTAFTPNGDGYNDTWEPRFDYCVEGVVELAIFDRWGNNLYKSENIAAQGMIGWDGRANGADLDSGVFVFMMRVRYNDGTVSGYINGDMTLLR